MSSLFFRRPSDVRAEEEQGMEHLAEIQNTLKELRKSTDEGEKQILINQFLIHLDSFILLTSTKLISNANFNSICKEMLEYSPLIDNNAAITLLYMKVLTKAYGISQFPMNCRKYCNILISVCKISNQLPTILSLSQSFFETFLRKPNFITEFSSTSSFEYIFQNIFINSENEQAAIYVNTLLFNQELRPHYKNVNYIDFFQFAALNIRDDKITDTLAEQSALFISNMFQFVSSNSRQITKFFSQNSLIIFDCLVSKTTFEKRANCYKSMLYSQNEDGSSPPNLQIYKHLYKIFVETSPMQQSIFLMISELFTKIPESISKLDQNIPTQNLFNWNFPNLNDMALFLSILDKTQPKLVFKCLPIVFNCIIRVEPEIDSLVMILKVLIGQITMKYLTYNMILETNFLSAFVVQLSPNITVQLYSKYENFASLVLSLYSLEGAISFRPSVFKAVLNLKINTLNKLLTAFLSISAESNIIRILLEFIQKTGKIELIQSLNAVLVFSQDAAVNFVISNGISWAFDNLKLEDLVELLAALVCTRRFDELEHKIASLPDNHPLFSAPQNLLEKVIFGLNKATCRPIRVHSLVHLLVKPMKLDPYNAWLLGNSFIEQSLKRTKDIFHVPMIDQIANRFLQAKYLKLLLERPYELERFCDTSFDHFQLFQFYPGNSDLSFDLNFSAVTFWFKTNNHHIHSLRFIKTDVLNISLDDGKIIINCDDQTNSLNLDLTRWNFIAIKIESSLMSSSLALNVNGRVFTFQLKSKRSNLTFCRFCAATKDLIFLGSAIRFFKTSPKSFTDVLNSSANCVISLYDDETIITPISLEKGNFNVYIPSNCVLVPYFGFPMLFLSNFPLRKLLESLHNSQDEKQFSSVFRTLLNIQEITHYETERFYWILIGSISNSHKFISKNLFLEFLVSLSKNSKSESALTSILLHKKMWDNVNNDILVESIFEQFNENDFRSVANFEIFLTKKIMDNNGLCKMILAILRNINKVPLLKPYINCLLRIGSDEMKSNILDALIEFIDKLTYETVLSICPFEFLVQLCLIVSLDLKIKIIHLMSLLNSYQNDYVLPTRIMQKIVSQCSFEDSVWKDIIVILDQSKNPEIYNLGVVLMSFGTISCFSGNTKLEKYVNDLSLFMLKKINNLSENQSFVICLSTWLSICLNINYLNDRNEFKYLKSNSENIKIDIDDKIWINIDKVLSKPFRLESVDINAVDYLEKMNIDKNNINFYQICHFSNFINNFLILANPSFICSFIISFVSISKIRNDPLIKIFMINALNYILTNPPKTQNIINLFSSLLFLSNSNYLEGFETDIFLHILTFINSLLGNNDFITSISYVTDCLLINLFSHLSEDKIPLIVSHIVSCSKAFSILVDNSKSLFSWIYILLNSKTNTSLFFDKISNKVESEILSIARKGDIFYFEPAYKQKSIEISLLISSIAVKDFVSKNLPLITLEYHKMGEISIYLKRVYDELMSEVLSSLNSEFIVLEEMVSWMSFSTEIKDQKSSIDDYSPIYFTLCPRSFPFYPPRLLSPSYFSRGEIEYDYYSKKAVATHRNEMTDLFLKIHNNEGNLLYKFNTELSRFSQKLHCSVFFFETSFDVVTFSELKSHNLILQDLDHDEMKNLINESIQGDWGSTSIFAGRIVITVKYSQLIYVLKNEQKYVFWGFECGSFILTFSKQNSEEISPFISKICEKCLDSLPPFPFIHRVKSIEEALQKFANGLITATDTLLIYNALCGRFFVNNDEQPVFPRLSFSEESLSLSFHKNPFASRTVTFPKSIVPQTIPTSKKPEINRRNSTPDIFSLNKKKNIKNPTFYDIDKIPPISKEGITPLFMSIPELLKYGMKMSSYINEKLESEKNAKQVFSFCNSLKKFQNSEFVSLSPKIKVSNSQKKPICNIHNVITPQMTSIKAKHIIFDGESIKSSPLMSHRLHCSRDLIFQLDTSSMSIIVTSIRTGNVVFRRTSPTLVYCIGFSLSENGLLLVVDYAFCLSRSFRIKYEFGIPTEISSLSAISLPVKPISDICGYDCIVVTSYSSTLVIWDAFSGTIHRKVELPETIVKSKFDEDCGLIWVLTEMSLFLYTINGTQITSREFKKSKASSLNVYRLSNSESIRFSLVGFVNGSIVLASYRPDYSTIEIKELQSPHHHKIISLQIHGSNTCFTSSDSDLNVTLWTSIGVSSPRFRHELLTRCPICGSISSEQCQSCSRLCCKRCCMNGTCLLCTGLSLYV